MTARETRLTVFLVGVLFVVGLVVGAKVVYFNPAKALQEEEDNYRDLITKKKNDIQAQKQQIADLKKMHPRLQAWQKLSLPDVPGKVKSDAAYQTHMNKLQIEYQRYIDELLSRNRFRVTSVNPNKLNVKAGEEIAKGRMLYRKLSFTVNGQGTLESIIHIMEDLHRTPLLHQIKDFTLTRSETSSGTPSRARGREERPGGDGGQPGAQPGNGGAPAQPQPRGSTEVLDARFTIEALLVTGAEKREGLFPKFEEKEKRPSVLASANRRYDSLLENNPFYPVRPERDNEGGPPPPKEDKRIVLKYVKLTGIYCKENRRRKATLINLGNKDDVTTLAVSPAWEAFLIRDRYGEEVLRGKIVYLDESKAVMQIEGACYLLNLGEDLGLAIARGKMSDSELKTMGVELPKEATTSAANNK